MKYCWRKFLQVAALGFGTALVSSYALSAEKNGRVATDGTMKTAVWSFGITGAQENLKAAGNNQLIGTSAAVQIGYGHIARDWLANFSVDILQGPYQPTYDSQLQVDHSGFGFTAWTGLSAQNTNVRSPEGGYGFALGLSYGALTGQMMGRNRRDDGQGTAADRALIDSYTSHVSKLSIIPGLFFTWLDQARPTGNTPELLMTRIEGLVLLIGAATPIAATYNTSYTKGTNEVIREHGSLSGYSIVVNLTALLGV